MLDKSLEEEQAARVDERLARVVRIIVEQYHGDVKAFVEAVRYIAEVTRKAEAESDHGDEENNAGDRVRAKPANKRAPGRQRGADNRLHR